MLAASCETADPALGLRVAGCTHQKRRRGQRLHVGSSRRKRRTASGSGFYLFDGIDHPLRIKQVATSTTAYYEIDLAGNVRRLRASGGGDLGGYRYSAFGKTKQDTTTLTQQLRWKGRWQYTLNGQELYDVRARQWAPEIGSFMSIDEYREHDAYSTLWGWPVQNPVKWRDTAGSRKDMCDPGDSNCGGYYSPPPPKPDPATPGAFCAAFPQLCGGGNSMTPPGGPGTPGNDNECKPDKKFCDDLLNDAMDGCKQQAMDHPDPRFQNMTWLRIRICVREVMNRYGCDF